MFFLFLLYKPCLSKNMKLLVIVLVAAIDLCTISFAGDKNKASQKILSGRSVQCNKGY